VIGNDIVDLKLASTQSNWRRKGFLQKLFTAEEQKFILNAVDSEFNVWLLWSMKEAVYKLVQRKYKLNRFFDPKQFGCKVLQLYNEEARGAVFFKNEVFETTSIYSSAKIHTYAANTEFTLVSESENTRFRFLAKISEQLEIPLESLNISKNKQGIPFLTYGGDNLQIPFSLSHHGRYSAYAFSLNLS